MLYVYIYIKTFFFKFTGNRNLNAPIGLHFVMRSAWKSCVKASLQFKFLKVGTLQEYYLVFVQYIKLKTPVQKGIYKILLSLLFRIMTSVLHLTILMMSAVSLFISFTFDYIWSQVYHNSHNTKFASVIWFNITRILIVTTYNMRKYENNSRINLNRLKNKYTNYKGI
jgi:hypothetical protein